MYRFNGVSMPGFSVGLLLAMILGFCQYSLMNILVVSAVTWIVIDVMIIAQMSFTKKNDSE